MKKLLFIVCITLLFSSSTCYDDEPEQRTLTLINRSKERVFFSVCFNYPDTSFYVSDYCGTSHLLYEYRRTIEPDELFERNKVLQVFFVSFISEEGRLGDSILARYEFTRAALDRCDWTVVYPSGK